MRFHFFHREGGRLHNQTVECSLKGDAALRFARVNAPDDHHPVAGHLDPQHHVVDVSTGHVMAIKADREKQL